MAKILLAEDDESLGELLSDYLAAKGHEVELATDGETAYEKFLSIKFSLCILDVMMPKKDGFTLAKEIRMKNEEIPIIFLTAKSMKEDTIKGFQAGADDYLAKPFDMEELLLRMKAILKRSRTEEKTPEKTILLVGNFTFNTLNRTLKSEQELFNLTTKEAALLKLFVENINKPVNRNLALKLIWGDDSYFNARSMDVYITKLRKFLKSDPTLKILNLHGEGFQLLNH